MEEIPGFTRFELAALGTSRPVYRRGSGPGVLVIHELPGMIPECIDLGRRLAEAGFLVYLPLLFGKPGQNRGALPLLGLCVRREFNLWRAGRSSPILGWLRALSRHLREECANGRVGAIGMCLTGGFALTLLLDDWLMAPVLSQPSLPLALPWQRGHRAALDICPRDLAEVKARVEAEDLGLLAFRFAGDRVSPPERLETLKREFPGRLRAVELPGDLHSVLTQHFGQIPEPQRGQVWDELVGFLRARLQPGPAAPLP